MRYLVLLSLALCSYHFVDAQCSAPKPQNFHIVSITSCSISLQWKSSDNTASYKLWYKLLIGGNPVIVNTGTDTSHTLNGLESNTKYQFRVAAFCANGNTNGYTGFLKAITKKCSGIENLSVQNTSIYDADVLWSSPCNPSSFRIRYRTTSPLSEWLVMENIPLATTTLQSLSAYTNYEVQGASSCGSDTSQWSPSVFFQTLLPSQPNVILILQDDGRYDAFERNGGPSWFETPAINRLADEGINFKYTMVATSQCTPSQCSMVTGLYPHHHGAVTNGTLMYPGLPLIQDILHENGYYTGFVGKYAQNGIPPGYDWVAKSSGEDYLDPHFKCNGVDSDFIGQHYTDVVQMYALEFLNSVPEGQPFMLFLSTIVPHGPTIPRDEDSDLFLNEPIPFPSNFYKYNHNYPSYTYINSTKWNFDAEQTDSLRLLEFQTTIGLDYNVNAILESLKQKGILNSTFILLTSDNGYMKGEHLLGGKQLAYEESIRVPLFIRYPPWFNAGTLIEDEIASNIDIAPTLLELAGIPDTFNMDGVSLFQLSNNTINRKDFMYQFAGEGGIPPIRAVRGIKFKYVKSFCDSVTEEFYNLEEDLSENINEVNNSMYSFLLQKYRNKLDSLRQEFTDVLLQSKDCYLKNPALTKEAESIVTTNSSWIIYPNPAEEMFVISNQNESIITNAEVRVYDFSGRIIYEHLFEASSSINISCIAWAAGFYWVEIRSDKEKCFLKVVVH